MLSNWDEYSRRRLSNEERVAIMTIDLLTRSWEHSLSKLRGRLGEYKNLKRDLGFIKYSARKIIEAALEGTEDDIAAHLVRQSRDWRLGLERVGPTRRQEEVTMPLEDEWQMIHIVLESRCGLCMMTDGEARMCKIRKLLRKYCDEPEPQLLHGCGYQGTDLNDNVKAINRPERL